METLEIKINGAAATKSNFTKNDRPSDELERKRSTAGKKRSPSTQHKVTNVKKNNKKSKFPKIILYQGPLSKDIERMLYGKMSSSQKKSEIMKILKKSQKTAASSSSTQQQKKYKVKGYVDNVRVDAVSSKKKPALSAGKN